ncbi:anti-repressor SinI family protein [Paenibacillus sp. 3LSP]|nr:anti-repressor SinI family protein [Paenibacillus sp. 3LSP]
MLKKSAQVISYERFPGNVDPEWVMLLAMAKEAGISIEEVRRFFAGDRSYLEEWHVHSE